MLEVVGSIPIPSTIIFPVSGKNQSTHLSIIPARLWSSRAPSVQTLSVLHGGNVPTTQRYFAKEQAYLPLTPQRAWEQHFLVLFFSICTKRQRTVDGGEPGAKGVSFSKVDPIVKGDLVFFQGVGIDKVTSDVFVLELSEAQ